MQCVKGQREPLQLSLDARVQFILREELQRVINDFTAKGAAGIIMDVRTGEIIAMVSLPDFDPEPSRRRRGAASAADAKERMFNKITLGAYELGSVFKIFNTAMALDAGTATMAKNLRRDPRHPDRPLHDQRLSRQAPHAERPRNLHVLVEPRLGADGDGGRRPSGSASFLGRLGLLKPVPIEFDEVAKPHFPAQWREVNVITIAYGHGISVTPLHVATARLGDRQWRHPASSRPCSRCRPALVPPGERVISPKTSEQMRKLMRLVVEHGTAQAGRGAGLCRRRQDRHGGEERQGGHYQEKKLLSDFVGVFPMHDPKYLVLTAGRRAARQQAEPRLCDRRLDRGAGDQPHRPAHRADPGRAAGRRDISRRRPQALTVESLQGKRIETY